MTDIDLQGQLMNEIAIKNHYFDMHPSGLSKTRKARFNRAFFMFCGLKYTPYLKMVRGVLLYGNIRELSCGYFFAFDIKALLHFQVRSKILLMQTIPLPFLCNIPPEPSTAPHRFRLWLSDFRGSHAPLSVRCP